MKTSSPPPSGTTQTDIKNADSNADLKAASAAERVLPPSSTPSAIPSPPAEGVNSSSEDTNSSRDIHSSKDINASSKDVKSASTDIMSTSPSSSAPPVLPTEGDSEDEKELTKEERVEEALNCPCIASMKEGPCGESFIAAYRCFLESESDPKGMECMDQFQTMQTCIADHPDDYKLDDDDPEADGDIRTASDQSSKDNNNIQAETKNASTNDNTSSPSNMSQSSVASWTSQTSSVLKNVKLLKSLYRPDRPIHRLHNFDNLRFNIQA